MMIPASAAITTAQTTINRKFRWMPGSVIWMCEAPTWMCSLKKNPEPNHPTEYAPSA